VLNILITLLAVLIITLVYLMFTKRLRKGPLSQSEGIWSHKNIQGNFFIGNLLLLIAYIGLIAFTFKHLTPTWIAIITVVLVIAVFMHSVMYFKKGNHN